MDGKDLAHTKESMGPWVGHVPVWGISSRCGLTPGTDHPEREEVMV